MFIVQSSSPLDEKWEARDKLMAKAAGRRPERSSAGSDGEESYREHVWTCASFGDAQRLRRQLESVESVTASIREYTTSPY